MMKLTNKMAPFEVIEGGRFIRLQRAKEAFNLWRAGRTEREIANRLDIPRPSVMPLVLEGQEIDTDRRIEKAWRDGRRSLLCPPPGDGIAEGGMSRGVTIPGVVGRSKYIAKWPEKGVYDGMMRRCYDPSSDSYHNYGGRGITVCDEWRGSYEVFVRDMGRRPSNRHSIERIDNQGLYSQGNCCWATQAVQCRNSRTNHYIECAGHREILVDWAKISEISVGAIRGRINRGWHPTLAISVPVRDMGHSKRRSATLTEGQQARHNSELKRAVADARRSVLARPAGRLM